MTDLEMVSKENFLQLIMDNIPQFIFWKDKDGIYLGCNKNFALAAGFDDPKEIIGKTDYDLPWSKEESDFYRMTDIKVMEEGVPKINFEEQQTQSDGSLKWLKTNKIPLRNSVGDVIGILGTFEDITDKKEMELAIIEHSDLLLATNKDLEQTNLDLEQANVDLEQFSYAVSHDLQEPLRMIGSYASLINKKYCSVIDDNGKEYINFIMDGVTRMSKLIRGILTYSKVDKTEDLMVESNLNEIIQEKLKDLSSLIQEKNALIHLHLPEKTVKCQPTQIGVLFYNLIYNGIKFNKNPLPTIDISFEEKVDEWIFSIADNGIGIEQQYAQVIFKAFKRLNNRSEFPGSGIGLSICKRIVNLHQGAMWLSSNPSERDGSTFYFSIKKEKPTFVPATEMGNENSLN